MELNLFLFGMLRHQRAALLTLLLLPAFSSVVGSTVRQCKSSNNYTLFLQISSLPFARILTGRGNVKFTGDIIEVQNGFHEVLEHHVLEVDAVTLLREILRSRVYLNHDTVEEYNWPLLGNTYARWDYRSLDLDFIRKQDCDINFWKLLDFRELLHFDAGVYIDEAGMIKKPKVTQYYRDPEVQYFLTMQIADKIGPIETHASCISAMAPDIAAAFGGLRNLILLIVHRHYIC